MNVDLAGTKAGISERFAPDQDRGRLIEVEHMARYRWAVQAARGRRVLDAGCGSAYGTRLLAEAGAQSVVGVDIAAGVLDAIRPSMPDGVTLEAGDLRSLPFGDSQFDLIVCFEVIEHFEDPFPVLDELVRVLTADGILLISSPNRGIYPPGNPHHFHEFTPNELEAALTERLRYVTLRRQHDLLVSAVLDDATVRLGDGEPVGGLELRKLAAQTPGDEVYTVAVAGNGELPDLGALGAITGPLEFSEWLSVFDVQTNAIDEKDNYIGELEARLAERDAIAARLLDAEQRLATLPERDLRIADLEYEVAEARKLSDELREQVKYLDDRLMRSQQTLNDVLTSPSWQATKPLRAAKKLLRG